MNFTFLYLKLNSFFINFVQHFQKNSIGFICEIIFPLMKEYLTLFFRLAKLSANFYSTIITKLQETKLLFTNPYISWTEKEIQKEKKKNSSKCNKLNLLSYEKKWP